MAATFNVEDDLIHPRDADSRWRESYHSSCGALSWNDRPVVRCKSRGRVGHGNVEFADVLLEDAP